MKTINIEIQSPSKRNMKKTMQRHIITQVLKTSDKILKATRKKKKKTRMTDFLSKTKCKKKDSRVIALKY